MAKELQINPMSDDLRRQRRSLITIGLVLTIMKYSGIKITKFSLFGAELSISNTNAVYILLWMMWFYFLIRFYEYYRQEGLASLRSGWLLSNDTCFSSKIKDYVKEQYSELESSSFDIKYSDLTSKNWFQKRYSARGHAAMKGKDIEVVIPIWKFSTERTKSFIHFVRNRSQFSDYVLPMMMAIWTFIYCGLLDWQGSFFNLILKP